MTILVFVKVALFFLCLWFFGARLGTVVLRKRHPLFSLGVGLSAGVSLYIFLVNALSYLVAPPASFFAGLAMVVTLGLLLPPRPSAEGMPSLTPRQLRSVIIAAVIISLLNGWVALRTLERDDYLPSHIPAAALFAQGNFPPRDPVASLFGLTYHYAPDLFSAAMHTVAGVPLWLGYDIQTGLFSGLIFLLAFLLVYNLFRQFTVAVSAAFALLYGGSLNVLLIFPFLSTVFKKFILGYDIDHPFRLIPDIVDGNMVRSLISQTHSHTNSLGFLLVLLVLYLSWEFQQKKISWLAFSVVGGALFGFLALSQETTSVILFVAFLPVLLLAMRAKDTAAVLGLLFFLLIAAVAAWLQGGVLSDWRSVLPTFSLAPKAVREGYTMTIVTASGSRFTFAGFFREFGLLLLLFFPAVALLWKRMSGQLLYLWIFTIGVSMFTPFIVHYLYAGEYPRLFHLAGSLLALLAGIYLSWKYFVDDPAPWKKRIILVFFFVLIAGGVLFQVTYAVFPLGGISFKPHPLIAVYPHTPITPLEERTRRWIHANTTIDDGFFAVDTAKKPYTSLNHRFVVLFGRFASTYEGTPTAEAGVYQRLTKNCLAEDLQKLKYAYMFVNNLWPDGLEERCRQNNVLSLVFEGADGAEFVRIYRIQSL